MVPLWFIRRRYRGGKIVRIGLSGLPLIDHYRLGMIIREAVSDTGRRAVMLQAAICHTSFRTTVRTDSCLRVRSMMNA